MTFEVRLAENRHITWLVAHDQHVSEDWVRRCVRLGEYLVAQIDEKPVGLLRFSWFWGTIPFMDMIYVLAEHRRSGIGRALFEQWEKDMQEKGATLLLTSNASDESEPRAWHRKNGFREAGRISFGHLQPVPEVFLIKDLRSPRNGS